MGTPPYGLNILDNCVTCPVREQHLFCNLSSSAVQRLNEITSVAVYPSTAMLFMEGEHARGAYVLCTGKAKLSATSRRGKTIITKISEHGDVLGLNATISNRPYEVTAEMVEPGQANFITSDALLQFLRDFGDVALRQFSHALEEFSISPDVCREVPAAVGLLNRRKFDAVIVDLQLGEQAGLILDEARLSASNRKAVTFAISGDISDVSCLSQWSS